MPLKLRHIRSRLRDRQGPPGLHRRYRRVAIGRIYETRGGPDSLRWFWSMTVNGPMTRSDRVAEGVGESGGDDAVGGSSAFVRARKVEAPSAFQGNRSFLGG